MNDSVPIDSSINMFYSKVVFLLCVINITKARIRWDISTEKCQNVSKNVEEVKLMDHIFCDFNGDNLRPVKDNKIATNLTIRLIPQSFAYDEMSATISVDAWLVLNWVDQHSNWNPKEFNGIDQVYLRESGLWKPDLLLFNRADRSKLGQFTNKISCRLRYTGFVSCVAAARHEATCIPDLSKFPYDTQKCKLRFGSWLYSGEQLNVRFGKPAFTLENMETNGNWDLLSLTTHKNQGKMKCCSNITYPSLEYNFLIKRITANHAATIIIPSIVLLLITLTALWIPPNQEDRMHMCLLNLILHFMHLEYVSDMVPTHGPNTPYLVCYSRDSMLLASFSILFSIMLKNFIEGSVHAPAWVSNSITFLADYRILDLVLLNDHSIKGEDTLKEDDDLATIIDNTNNNPTENQDWLVFGKVLDRILFIIYCIVYIIMFVSFLP